MMMLRLAAMAVACCAFVAVSPARAMSMADCSASYKSERAAGRLNGMTWNDFRNSRCNGEAAQGGATAPVKMADAAAKPAPQTAPEGVVFPSAIDPKFANEKPVTARMHTCLAQYRIDKAKNALGGLKWVQKGGGYYSLCSAKLKG